MLNSLVILSIIVLFAYYEILLVAKRELGDGIPFVSLLLRSQGHALVRRRGKSSQAMRSIRRFARRCEREGTCPVIFPEGTRSRDGEVGDFHTAGVRKILGEARLPIVVAVVEGGWRLASITGLMRNLRGARIGLSVLSVTPPSMRRGPASWWNWLGLGPGTKKRGRRSDDPLTRPQLDQTKSRGRRSVRLHFSHSARFLTLPFSKRVFILTSPPQGQKKRWVALDVREFFDTAAMDDSLCAEKR